MAAMRNPVGPICAFTVGRSLPSRPWPYRQTRIFPLSIQKKGLLQLAIKKPLGEAQPGGIALVSISGGTRVNVVPNSAQCVLRGQPDIIQKAVDLYNQNAKYPLKAEKRENDTVISSYGLAAHGSKPQKGHNAVAYLVAFLNTLPLQKSSATDMVYALGSHINTDCFGETVGNSRRGFFRPPDAEPGRH